MSPRTVSVAVVVLLAVTSGLAVELQSVQSRQAWPPLDFVRLGANSWVTTVDSGHLVNWTVAPQVRDEVWVTWEQRPTGLEVWGDSLVVHLEDAPTRLIHQDEYGFVWNLERAPGWHLPNLMLGDVAYRAFVDPAFYVLVYTAPGPGILVGLLDLVQHVGPQTMGAQAGAVVTVGSAAGAHVVDLSEPLLPGIVSSIGPPQPGLPLLDLAMSPGRAYLLWEGLVQTYDLSELDSPTLIDQQPCVGTALAASDQWVVGYVPETGAMQAFALSAAGALTPAATGQTDLPLMVKPQVHGDQLVLHDAAGLRAFGLSLADQMSDLGPAWPLLPSDRLVAHDGWAWCLGDRRRAGYRYRGTPSLAVWPLDHDLVDATVDGDRLVTATTAGVRLDALPADTEPPTGWLAAAAEVRALAAASGLVAMATTEALELLDATDPAAPRQVGLLPLTDPAVGVALHGTVAAVTTRPDAAGDALLSVDITDPADPTLADQIILEYDGGFWQTVAVVPDPDAVGVRVLCRRGDVVREVAVGLTDPAAPTLDWSEPAPDFWCYDQLGLPLADPRPARLEAFHVAARGDTVTVYSGPAGSLTPLASWAAPGPVSGLATQGNGVLVATAGRLDVLTFSDGSLVTVPMSRFQEPIQAIPNPFNPLTELRFQAPVAGRVQVTIHDVQGRRVRSLTVDGPAGTRRVAWDGRDDAGRALSSGQYLLRVVSTAGIQTGRCTLIR